MSDVPVYMLANITVTDPDIYKNYEKGFFGVLKRHGGEFVTFDDAPDTLEGDSPRPGRVAIFKFPSEAQARSWYADPDYQALAAHRRAGSETEFLTLVRGMPARS